MTEVQPFGTWSSPVDPPMAASASVIISDVRVQGRDVFWLELRPAEDGRTVLLRATPDGAVREVTPRGANVRSRVHEYGGGPYAVDGRTLVWMDDETGGLQVMPMGADAASALTGPADGRFGDLVLDSSRGRVLAVRECHDVAGADEPVNTLAAIDLETGAVTDLAAGCDFYAAPTLSPDGSELAWIEWDHPNMPWDGTTLRRGRFGSDGTLGQGAPIAGGRTEAAIEPLWTPGGELMFLTDRDGYWGIHRHDPTAPDGMQVVFRARCDLGRPPWKLGRRTWAIAPPRGILAGVRAGATTRLVAAPGRRATGVTPPVLDDSWARINEMAAGEGIAAFIATAPDRPTAVVVLDLVTDEQRVLASAPAPMLDPVFVRPPEMITFAGHGGDAYGWFYAPAHPDLRGPETDRPPLIVRVHGGPTGESRLEYDLECRYWTSRGWAVCDVDHGGSSGYGRAYRERLRHCWGVVDVFDAAAAARHLADAGRVDGTRMVITGGSAGGFTTLLTLATTDVFAAGANRFGVADLESFARETHKFESRYLEGLVGRLPEHVERYRERSAIHHLDGFTAPLAVFQGDEDRVVPPRQSEIIVEALEQRGVPVLYECFEGEQHGFRRQSSLQRTLVVQERFFRTQLGIDPQPE